MPSFAQLFPRARVRYKPLDNNFEMADHTIIPTNAHEEGREEKFADPSRYSHDMAGGDLDIQQRERDDSKLPNYETSRDSSSTLNQVSSEPDDVTEEELATLRRVSDKIPLSAWYDIPLSQVSR
jgi:hypothetical protein